MGLIKRFKNLDTYTKFSAIVIVLFSAIVFVLASIYHVSGDACWHISAARFIAEEKNIPLNEGLGREIPFWSPPLFHLVSAFIYQISGNAADTLVKFISPVFAVLTLIFTFLIVKRLFDEKIGFYTLLFLAFIPLFMDYSVFSYVESMLTFFVVLSVYFAIRNNLILASLAAGLGILTKYNALFIIPLLMYIAYRNRKNNYALIKNIVIIVVLPLLIASPWFMRNWLMLGNPVWPFLNFIFNGIPDSSFAGFHLERLADIDLVRATYLALFGVPNGDLNALLFFDMPYMWLLIAIWLIGTLAFILPLAYIARIKKIKNNGLLSLWIILYILLFLLYVPNVGFGVARIVMPALPALAIIWAHGFNKILIYKHKKIILLVFILVVSGFIFTEFVKITLAAREWNFYEQDFKWILSNTQKDSLIMARGQCIPYNIERQTVSPLIENLENAQFAFINQKFKLDTRTIIDDSILSEIKINSDLVYSNDRTKTEIYKIKQ